MKYFFLTLFFILSTNSYSQELSKEEIENLSFNRLQSLRRAYINFVIEAEKENPGFVSMFLNDYSPIDKAYAAGRKVCFFGGWPSVIKRRKCSKPWKQKNIKSLKYLEDTYTKDYACGKKDFFRCNPTLFGVPDETVKSPIDGITIDLDPKNGKEKGFCIKRGGTYKDLTKKCAKVSKGNIQKLIDDYQKDGKKLSDFSKAIGKYCKQKSKTHDPCEILRKRIKEITEGNPSPKTEEGKILVPVEVDQVLNQCKDMMKTQGLNASKIFQSLDQVSYACSSKSKQVIPPAYTSELKFLEMINEDVQIKDFIKTINGYKLEASLTALYANKIKWGLKPLNKDDLKDKESFYKAIIKEYPDLRNYRETTDRTWDNLNNLIKTKQLVQIESESAMKNLSEFGGALNKLCKNINDKYQIFLKNNPPQTIGDKVCQTTSICVNNDWDQKEEKFLNDQKKRFNEQLKTFEPNVALIHLLSTNIMKNKFMDTDTTSDFTRECSEDDQYKITFSVDQNLIDKAHQEATKIFKDGIKESQRVAKEIDDGDVAKMDKMFKAELTRDPTFVISMLKNMPQNMQKSLATKTCSQIVDISKSEKNWSTADKVAAGVTVFGGVLCIAGGAVTLGAVTYGCIALGGAGTLYSAGRLGDSVMETNRQKTDLQKAQVEGRVDMYSFLDKSQELNQQRQQEYIDGGLTIISAVIPSRVAGGLFDLATEAVKAASEEDKTSEEKTASEEEVQK